MPTNVRESRDIALCLPSVFVHETVAAVRAGDKVHGAAGVIVPNVVCDCGGGC